MKLEDLRERKGLGMDLLTGEERKTYSVLEGEAQSVIIEENEVSLLGEVVGVLDSIHLTAN